MSAPVEPFSRPFLSRLAEARRSRRLAPILCLADFEPAARRRLPRPLFGYISGAAETNASFADNEAAFRQIAFRPRILANVAARSQHTRLFGKEYRTPFGIAPMGAAAIMAYRGDIALAKGAHGSGIPMVLSGASLIRLEEVAQAAPGSWFQAYLPGENDKIDALVERVAAAGYETLVLTVDVAVLPSRENNIRNGFTLPLRPSLRLAFDGAIRPAWTLGTFARTLTRHGMPHFENATAERGAPILSPTAARDLGLRDHLNWQHLARMRERWKGNLVVKGILHPEDALMAVEAGADGIILSNHGGRQLDGAVSALRVLPEIARAVAGRAAVMLDGGVRRGTDVLKALALGADFVFVGRPFLYAAALSGEAGVRHAAQILTAEIDRDMALLGISAFSELAPNLLHPLCAAAPALTGSGEAARAAPATASRG